MNRFELSGEGIPRISRKRENNRIESDRAALKKRITAMRGFKSLSSAKDTLHGMEPGAAGEIRFVNSLFGLAA